ncbi:MAG: TIGR03756 family integrating conjugative element protein [Gammaproteobacteria bacterium]|nr:TIGR03756 family integrating conjugative element protein [Gammaproteobacteria bacterium]
MRKRARINGLVCLIYLILGSQFSHASTLGLNTAQITQATVEAIGNCLEWEVVGQCFWLKCSLLGCSVKTSPKVRHYRPDFVVAAQIQHDQLAWQELNELLRKPRELALQQIFATATGYPIGGGGVPHTHGPSKTGSLHYFEADVFGHPLIDIEVPIVSQVLCDGQTKPLIPYYQSLLDALAWREPLLDLSLDSLNPFPESIGTTFDRWGPIKPRCGWVLNPDPFKAAAVTAFRAVHLLTHDTVGRVKIEPNNRNSDYYQSPRALNKNQKATGAWQLIYPKTENTCNLLGRADVLGNLSQPLNHNRSYLWNLWRSYTCCEPAGQEYLGDIDY